MEANKNRTYKVVVLNSQGQAEITNAFLSLERALELFNEYQSKYSYYHKITIESIRL